MNVSPHIRELILKDFEARPDVRDACLRIVEFIEASDSDGLKHLSYSALRRAGGVEHDTVMFVAQYLSGSRISLLETKFEFIDEDFIDEVSPAELLQARRDGNFYHPGTGQPVENFESNIFMYFVPGETVVESE